MILEVNSTGAIGFALFCFLGFYALISWLWQHDPIEQIHELGKKFINQFKNKK